MCIAAGKISGGTGCIDANSIEHDASSAPTFASQPNNGGVSHETPGADTVAGAVSTSSSITSGTAIRGYVNSSGDQDWYHVDLVAGQQYTFALNGFGKGALADAFLHLYNASGVEIASDDDSGPLAGSMLTFTASASGSYYIGAAGYSSNVGQYMLTMNTGSSAYTPVVSVQDVADYLTNTYWEINGQTARHWATSSITVNLDGLEPERAVLARAALQEWSSVCNLTFVETHGAANITIDDTQPGQAYSTSSVSSDVISSSSVNISSDWYGGIDSFDSYTFQTFIHEIGHAIGLGHAGAYNGSATYGVDNVYANDTWQMSVMSYMSQNNDGDSYRFDMTPMMADIMAVQSMYGAASTQTGNTVYGFGSNAGSVFDFSTYSSAPALTIYDSSGNDTLNASGYSQNQLIDLRPGNFSNIGGLVGNIGIYVTSVIENAVGGSGNDIIIGNDADNMLTGGRGNDTIDGGAGTDTAVFSGQRLAYTITAIDGTTVRVSGPDGTDTLTNVELLKFDDQTIGWNAQPALQPDLVAQDISLLNASITSGASTTVHYTVTNSGSGAAVDSTIGIYLSTDGTFDSHDTLIATQSVAGLGAGASASGDVVVTLPTAGTYTLFAVADSGNTIGESNEGNNTSNGVRVDVAAPQTLSSGPSTDEWQLGSDGRWVASVNAGSHAGGSQVAIAGIGDFNHDGNSDVLWFNSSTGQVDDWFMVSGRWAASATIGTHPGTGWQIAGTGDFDGDGTSDVLWYSPGTGQTDIWQVAKGQWAASTSLGTHPGSYQLAGTGDINHDGTSDIVWFDPNSGNIDVWEAKNGNWMASNSLGSHAAGGWQVAGTGDFNHDGNSDVLFFNPTTGATDIWELANGNWAASVSPGSHPLGYNVAGIGDFNGDGTSDILWYNPTTGAIDEWQLANGKWAASIDLGAHPGGVAGVGDFNGNGITDILWHT